MRTRIEANIIVCNKHYEATDCRLFFGPLPDDEQFLIYHEGDKMPDVLRDVGIFKSKSEARRNGWNKPIPEGFSEITIGKLKNKLWIFNPVPNANISTIP